MAYSLGRKQKEKENMRYKKKKVEIAKDVLCQLNAEAYKAWGVYFHPLNDEATALAQGNKFVQTSADDFQRKEFKGEEMQQFALKAKCKVCAIGAAMISGIRLYDGVSGSMFDPADGCRSETAQKWFSEDELSIMENIFESYCSGMPAKVSDLGQGFNSKLELAGQIDEISRDARMRGIFKSIIQLDGKVKRRHMIENVLHEQKLERRRKAAAAAKWK